jgi:REP element-mobilizing transposase RayT
MAVRLKQLAFVVRTHGGSRPGAGRKRASARPGVAHRPRAEHHPRHPVHVTLRAGRLPASLRSTRIFPQVRGALARGSKEEFRVVAYSVQSDHVHLIVEADSRGRLAAGLQGLAIRMAKAVNRALGRRGTVWADRYHARSLTTPRAVRHALVYVLQNWKKHVPGGRGLDPRSSAAWFSGWRNAKPTPPASSPVATARTWLARWGWRRHGLIDVREGPRSPANAAASRLRKAGISHRPSVSWVP